MKIFCQNEMINFINHILVLPQRNSSWNLPRPPTENSLRQNTPIDVSSPQLFLFQNVDKSVTILISCQLIKTIHSNRLFTSHRSRFEIFQNSRNFNYLDNLREMSKLPILYHNGHNGTVLTTAMNISYAPIKVFQWYGWNASTEFE